MRNSPRSLRPADNRLQTYPCLADRCRSARLAARPEQTDSASRTGVASCILKPHASAQTLLRIRFADDERENWIAADPAERNAFRRSVIARTQGLCEEDFRAFMFDSSLQKRSLVSEVLFESQLVSYRQFSYTT